MEKIFQRIYKFEELFIGYALLGVALVASIQVFLRYTFGITYDWIDEGSRYMTILITFVGAGVCVRYGSHFAMDALVQYSPNRVKHLLKVLAYLVSSVMMAITCYYGWIQIGKLAKFGATTPSFQIPMYIPYLPIGIFTSIIFLRFLIEAVKHADGLIHDKPFEDMKRGH